MHAHTQESSRERRRVAELLSHLPSDVDVEALLRKAVAAPPNVRKRGSEKIARSAAGAREAYAASSSPRKASVAMGSLPSFGAGALQSPMAADTAGHGGLIPGALQPLRSGNSKPRLTLQRYGSALPGEAAAGVPGLAVGARTMSATFPDSPAYNNAASGYTRKVNGVVAGASIFNPLWQTADAAGAKLE